MLVACLIAACGATSMQAGGLSSPAAAGSQQGRFVYTGPTEGSPHICTAAQLAARPAPIVYRPGSLSGAQKVPLLIALHGAGGGPQSMEGLSHFQYVARQYGFVVAFPGSCNDAHPWGTPQDLTYMTALIGQLIASQNIDPSRVYVAGFSAGGYETWQIGCHLSSQVAAIAIVSGAMNGRLYNSCALSRPVSELLMVGTSDSTRYTGIPGRLPSPFQTTARWRTLDGCAPQAVSALRPVQVVSQQTWGVCADGSAVSLVLLQGAAHVWPPIGVGAPANYSASQAVWAFVSAHRASPSSLSASDAKLLSLRSYPARGRRTRLIATLQISEPLTVSASLASRSKATYFYKLGPRTVTATWTFAVRSRGHRRVVLTLRDFYGRARQVTRSVHLPS
jgi:polyhydroxybutyrate depolymerase